VKFSQANCLIFSIFNDCTWLPYSVILSGCVPGYFPVIPARTSDIQDDWQFAENHPDIDPNFGDTPILFPVARASSFFPDD
jgi:hypothetical protein